MEDNFIGRCARCLKRHAGKCALAAYLAFAPPILSAMDGQPHDHERPVITGTATDVSSTDTGSLSFYVSVPNAIVAASNYSGPAPKLWQFVERTPGAERPVTVQSSGQSILWAALTNKPEIT